jgi:3-phosphoshikimate 1-carboxyvinyltransferase
MNDLVVLNGGSLNGVIEIPGDKSISHRSVMFGAIADGLTRVHGCLMGEDVLATIEAFRSMGVKIDTLSQDCIKISGVGLYGLKSPTSLINLGNSGTSMRLLAGILAGASIDATLVGDASLSLRPMKRIVSPLRQMGADIEMSANETPPLRVKPARKLVGISYLVPVISAQVKSGLLLAGLYAEGMTRISENGRSRDHSERLLPKFGIKLDINGNEVSLNGGQGLTGCDITVPADISSAAFFMLGAAISLGSEILLPQVGFNETRSGVIEILRLMEADIEVKEDNFSSGEPVADILVRTSSLTGINIPLELIPAAIDEFPAIFIAAACATGVTVLRGAEELRHKESDRISVMADGLRNLGVKVETYPDGISITGGSITGGCVDAHGDHRVAMAFAMAALKASGTISIKNTEGINTSFPTFFQVAKLAGLRIK